MKKLSNTEAKLKKSVAYKKASIIPLLSRTQKEYEKMWNQKLI